MAVRTSSKAVEALKALKALQEDAKRKGLDKLSMAEIDAEIAACRRERRAKQSAGNPVRVAGRPRYKCSCFACLAPEGAPGTVVELALLGTFSVYVSRQVLDEYREVLARERFSRHQERIDVLLEGIEDVATVIEAGDNLAVCDDEDDNRFLECAQTAQADFLVTGNRKHFPARFEDTRLIAPRDFLAEIGF